MEVSRLHCRIPKPELDAFRSYCVAHELTMSRCLTGMLHTFNARQARMSEGETEVLRQNIEKQAHLSAQAFKAQGEQMVAEAAHELPLPSPPEAL